MKNDSDDVVDAVVRSKVKEGRKEEIDLEDGGGDAGGIRSFWGSSLRFSRWGGGRADVPR